MITSRVRGWTVTLVVACSGAPEDASPAANPVVEQPTTPTPAPTSTSVVDSAVDTAEPGVDGWTCGLINGTCYCDNVFEYPLATCPGSWRCCIYWPGDTGDACECSDKSDQECERFIAQTPDASRVDQCPPG